MIIHRLELNNFRQFRGQQTIEFCSGHKNVTVVYGENGRGKTGIFRALMFCLYGDKSLYQDSFGDEQRGLRNIGNFRHLLVNESVLRAEPGKSVTATVTLEFSHADSRYTLKRTVVGICTQDGGINQDDGKVELSVVDPLGNDLPTETDESSIGGKIASILNPRIRDYFLFDGERIERLTRISPQQKKEVQRGIKTILCLDDLDIAILGLTQLKKRLDDEVAKNSEGQLKALELEKQRVETSLEGLEASSLRSENAILLITGELAQISEQLEKIKEVSEKERLRRQREEELEAHKNAESQIYTEMRRLTNVSGALVAGLELGGLEEHLAAKVSRGELPQHIKVEFIEKLLKRRQCICGSNFQCNDSLMEALTAYKNTLRPESSEVLITLYHSLGRLGQRRDSDEEKSRELFQKLKQERFEIESKHRAVKTLSEEIQQMGGDTSKELSTARAKRESELAEQQRLLQRYQVEGEAGKRRLKEIDEQIKREVAKDQAAQQARVKRDRIDAAVTTLKDLRKNYANRVREDLQRKSTEIFGKLADEETRLTLSSIQINEDYSLDVVNHFGSTMLADISAGQRQIVSLSFISALISVAGGKDGYEVPLFMDTPFGRLSFEHRDALLKSIPTMATQWVLLATDTELGRDESECLRGTGRWGAVYVLEPQEAGVTRITRESVGTFEPRRGVGASQ